MRDLIRAQLLALPWRNPPAVVLMPVHTLYRDRMLPIGLHAFVLEVLRPLVEQGRIRLLDHSDDFIADGRTDCHMFWDLFHQNNAGRAALARTLQPELMHALGLD